MKGHYYFFIKRMHFDKYCKVMYLFYKIIFARIIFVTAMTLSKIIIRSSYRLLNATKNFFPVF